MAITKVLSESMYPLAPIRTDSVEVDDIVPPSSGHHDDDRKAGQDDLDTEVPPRVGDKTLGPAALDSSTAG